MAAIAQPGNAAARPPKGDGRRRIFWFLSLPPTVALVALVVIPVVLMAALSFRPDLNGNLLGPFAATTKNYQNAVNAGVYVQLLLT